MIISGSLGYNNCEIKKFKILQGMRKENCQVQTLDFRQAEFGLFGRCDSLRSSSERAKWLREAGRSVRTFKSSLFEMQENEQISEGAQNSGGSNIKRQ